MWSSLWWPATGLRDAGSGTLIVVGGSAGYWSSTRSSPVAYHSYRLGFDYTGAVNPSSTSYRGYGFSVRCVQEEVAAV